MEDFNLKQTREHRDAMAHVSQKRIERITEGKISIKYYLNTTLQSKTSDSGVKIYPLYFAVTVKRKTARGKSKSLFNLMSVEDFNNIENIINFSTIDELEGKLKHLTDLPFTDVIDISSYGKWLYSILSEKNDLYTIVEEINPFNKIDFDINDVIALYDLYNSKLKIGINKSLKKALRELLEIESKSGNILAGIYLRTINWSESNAYDLWFIFKEISQSFYILIKEFSRCFMIISNHNFNISEEEFSIINEVSNQTLKDMEIQINHKDFFYKNSNYTPVLNEVMHLFFGK